MSKIDEAISILAALGLPRAQQNERSALTLLALAKLGPDDAWAKVERPLLRIWDIMEFMRELRQGLRCQHPRNDSTADHPSI